jgi:hypothetical protein
MKLLIVENLALGSLGGVRRAEGPSCCDVAVYKGYLCLGPRQV